MSTIRERADQALHAAEAATPAPWELGTLVWRGSMSDLVTDVMALLAEVAS